LYPYGDPVPPNRPGGPVMTQSAPVYDDGDERAARWTLRFLAVAVLVAVMAATVMFSLFSLDDSAPSSSAGGSSQAVETVTTQPAQPQIGPLPNTEVPGYVSSRKSALASTRDERVAVVSLAKYSTQTQAKALVGSLPVVALLVAPPGIAPSVVTGDLAAWTRAQSETSSTELAEIKKLIPTVTDPAFKSFYASEVTRLEKALKTFAPDSALVFGVVVRGPASALQALGAKGEVRLVDVGDTATPAPNTVYRGLRPEEVAKANEPPLRPV
jgi:hypothetical protein